MAGFYYSPLLANRKIQYNLNSDGQRGFISCFIRIYISFHLLDAEGLIPEFSNKTNIPHVKEHLIE